MTSQGDQGFGITILVTALFSGLIFLGKAVNGDFEGPGEGLFYAMEVIGGSMFVTMLFGLWLRGGFSRKKAEIRAAGKALEECFVGMAWGW